MVLLLVLTNLASILVFSGAGAALHAHVGRRYPALHAWGSSKLLRELNATGLALAASHAEVVDLSSRLSAANKQLEAILGGSAAKRDMEAAREEQWEAAANGLWRQELPPGGELRLARTGSRWGPPSGSAPRARCSRRWGRRATGTAASWSST